MAIENVVYHIPKESYDYVKKAADYIDNYLLGKLGDCVMRNLVAEGEIVVKLSELCKEEFTPSNSIQLKRQIAWKPLVRCGECKWCDDKGKGRALICTNPYIDMDIHPLDFCSYGERRAE